MKAILQRLFLETLAEIAPEKILPQQVRLHGQTLHIANERIDLDDYDRIVIAALGKAAFTMTTALTDVLPPRPVRGIAVGPSGTKLPIDGIKSFCGGHPYPDHASEIAAKALLKSLAGLGSRDLVFFLLSGGGSALAECAIDPVVSQADLGELHRLLVTAGVGIVDINVVRKHFSGIKGGRLAAAAIPARQVTLYISDVPAGYPAAVASGPTMPDDSTVADVLPILQRYGLVEQTPDSLQNLLHQGLSETPKTGDSTFARSSWHCLLDNDAAIETIRRRAKNLGWIVDVDTQVDDWPLGEAVNALLNRLEKLSVSHPGKTVCLISGGELSCPVTGDGIGGRNQAFVLEAVPKIAGTDFSVLSAGTDGIDGNSSAAGAFADGETMQRAVSVGLSASDFQQRSDAYAFFKALDDVIIIGPTGNNVRDLRVLVRKPAN